MSKLSKFFRAVADGFYNGQLVSAGATFEAHDAFSPNWAVEVEGHPATPLNAGEQEALLAAIAPDVPVLDNPIVPLPDFHPQVAVARTAKEDSTADALAAADDGTGTPVIRTADVVSTSDPDQATPSSAAPKAENAAPEATPIAPSDADVAQAKSASDAEVAAQAAADDAKSEDHATLI